MRRSSRIALALAGLALACASPEQEPVPGPPPRGPESDPPPEGAGRVDDPAPPPVVQEFPPSQPPGPASSLDGHVWYYFPNLELYLDETDRRFYWRQSIGWFDSPTPPRDLNPVGEERVNVDVGGRTGESGPADADLDRHRREHPKVH